MTKLSFNSVVGRKRLSGREDSFEQSDTRAARGDMKAVIAQYRRFVKKVEDVTPQILLEALQPTFEKSQTYVPQLTGALKASGYLEITSFRGTPRVEIGYGRGGEPEYAAQQHENLDFHHRAPERAKFLQSALEEDAAEIQARIVNALRV